MTQQLKTYGLIGLALAGAYLLYRNKSQLMRYWPGGGGAPSGDEIPGEDNFSIRNPLMASIEMGFPRGYYNQPGSGLPLEPAPSTFSVKNSVTLDPIELGNYAYVN